MMWNPFQVISKKFVGIDIGTASIKIVELSKWGERLKLENYGEIGALTLYEKPFRSHERTTLLLSSQDISRAISAVVEKTKIKTKEVVFSIPDFSSFFTFIELPAMTKEEIPDAVKYEAHRHIPLPLSEVTLDWVIVEGKTSNHIKTDTKVLLVAVPTEVINQYQDIATIAQLKLVSLEAEIFGLSRSLVKDKKGIVAIADIGAQSTTVNIIQYGVLKHTHSFDVAGNELTRILSQSLNINFKEAEELKRKYGLIRPDDGEKRNVKDTLSPLVDLILVEIERLIQSFYQAESKEVEKVILAGGSALLPGFQEYER